MFAWRTLPSGNLMRALEWLTNRRPASGTAAPAGRGQEPAAASPPSANDR